ncbi:phosphomannomutase/phosphoglucomutase [Pseudomaricurvus hydrocarbonicus]
MVKKHNNNKAALSIELPMITTAALAISLCLILASAWWSYDTWVTRVENTRLQQLSQQQASKHAAGIARFIKEQQQQLDYFTERPATVDALQSADPDLNTTLLKSLQTAYPQALSFKLLSLDRTDHFSHLQGSSSPKGDKLSFTELDMINRTEKREAVAPEALRVDKQWYLHFISALIPAVAPPAAEAAMTEKNAEEEAPVTGTLLATLPATELFNRIKTSDPELGKTELLRLNPGSDTLIFSASQGDAGATIKVPVKNSQWLVQFTPSAQLVAQANQSPLLLIAIHLSVGAGWLWLAFWLTGKFDPQRQGRSTQASNNITDPAAFAYRDQDILDIQVNADDEELLGLQDAPPAETVTSQQPAADPGGREAAARPAVSRCGFALPEEIFRAYDIRGKAGEQITVALAEQVGKAVASAALAVGESRLLVARDGRTHSPELCDALIRGVKSTGCNVLNLGAVPTPLLYFATCEHPDSNSGVMVTASHNSAEHNGFKMVINGHTLVDDDVQDIKARIQDQDFPQGEGSETAQQIMPAYIDRILSDVALAGEVKLVIDAGNAITGGVAPSLFEELGCEVVPLYCELDGSFPNHDPDPTIVANLQDLIRTVQTTQADLGVAFDGDGDRLVVVTPKGQILWPDRLLMLFAKDIVSRNPGADVLFDIKCTRELNSLVSSYGGRPIMWKAGHSHMKTKMQETGALVGGEMSGHIFIKDRWYGFDDGMYAAARLLEIMTLRDQDIDSLFESFPVLPSTPELKIPVAEERKFAIVEQLIQQGDFQNGKPITIDGLRVDFSKGWGLVRASNTSAALTLRFEAETEAVLAQLQQLFKRELLKIDSALDVPF